jgi:hypothetical protein
MKASLRAGYWALGEEPPAGPATAQVELAHHATFITRTHPFPLTLKQSAPHPVSPAPPHQPLLSLFPQPPVGRPLAAPLLPLRSLHTGQVRRGGGARNDAAFPTSSWPRSPASLPPGEWILTGERIHRCRVNPLRRADPHRCRAWQRDRRGVPSLRRVDPAGAPSSSSCGGSGGRGFGGGKNYSGRGFHILGWWIGGRGLHSVPFSLSLSLISGGWWWCWWRRVVVVLAAEGGGGVVSGGLWAMVAGCGVW